MDVGSLKLSVMGSITVAWGENITDIIFLVQAYKPTHYAQPKVVKVARITPSIFSDQRMVYYIENHVYFIRLVILCYYTLNRL